MTRITVVFDFDKTIIDCDSDNWVVEELGASDVFNQLLPTMSWNNLMDSMMTELHKQGRTVEEIAECLKRTPLHPKIIAAIKSAHALGCELKVVSDANTFFIETILKHHGLSGLFSEINTNPSYIDEVGTLRIKPFRDYTVSPHGCDLCPPNMCKGLVIERMKASAGKNRFIYIGDGKGDFCPSLKLGECDFMMPRKNYPVWELICNNRNSIKAEVHEWNDGEDLERILLHLINTIISDEEDSSNFDAFISADCKFDSVPYSQHKRLPLPLPIRQ